jgi:hypothetical protein
MLVEGRLKREMENLEKYLRSAGGDAIIAMIDAGSEEGQLFYPDSGETFKWVTLLRAADLHWSSKDVSDSEIVLFRMREEGLKEGGPQISVRCWDRY